MSKRIISSRPACVALFAGAIMLGANSTTLVADDCLAVPNRAAAPGGHWYFHADRANGRRCWYLSEPGPRTRTAEAALPPAEPPAQPAFGSFFSLMGLSSTPIGPQPETTGSVGHSGDIVRPDDRRSAAAPNPRAAVARRPDSQAALAPRPHRSPPARPPVEHADAQPASPPEGAERDVLFQEFLRWRDRKTE